MSQIGRVAANGRYCGHRDDHEMWLLGAGCGHRDQRRLPDPFRLDPTGRVPPARDCFDHPTTAVLRETVGDRALATSLAAKATGAVPRANRQPTQPARRRSGRLRETRVPIRRALSKRPPDCPKPDGFRDTLATCFSREARLETREPRVCGVLERWREKDSNLRRLSQRIYSPSPLTARESRRAAPV